MNISASTQNNKVPVSCDINILYLKLNLFHIVNNSLGVFININLAILNNFYPARQSANGETSVSPNLQRFLSQYLDSKNHFTYHKVKHLFPSTYPSTYVIAWRLVSQPGPPSVEHPQQDASVHDGVSFVHSAQTQHLGPRAAPVIVNKC